VPKKVEQINDYLFILLKIYSVALFKDVGIGPLMFVIFINELIEVLEQ